MFERIILQAINIFVCFFYTKDNRFNRTFDAEATIAAAHQQCSNAQAFFKNECVIFRIGFGKLSQLQQKFTYTLCDAQLQLIAIQFTSFAQTHYYRTFWRSGLAQKNFVAANAARINAEGMFLF